MSTSPPPSKASGRRARSAAAVVAAGAVVGAGLLTLGNDATAPAPHAATSSAPRAALAGATNVPVSLRSTAAKASKPVTRSKRLERDSVPTQAPSNQPAFRPRQVIVKFDASASAADRAEIRKSIGATTTEVIDGDLVLLRLERGRGVNATVDKLSNTDGVEFAQRNNTYELMATPNDPDFPKQWGLEALTDADIDASAGWDATDASATTPVTVAVVDAGVDPSHPDLANQLWTNPGETGVVTGAVDNCSDNDAAVIGSQKKSNGIDDDCNGHKDDWRGWDFSGKPADHPASVPYLGDNDPSGPHPHGTHVAGILGAERNNGIGLAGVSKQARIMPVQILGVNNTGDELATYLGLQYAVANGAKVVNGSFGSTTPNPTTNPLVDSLVASAPDVLFVFAAGNDASSLDGETGEQMYPCEAPGPNVVCVGATNSDDLLALFSNFGSEAVDLVAPGAGIWSSLPGGAYGNMSGTSMAAPMVAGAAAVLRSANPSWSPAQVRARLMETTDPLLTPEVAASGRLNLARAISGGTAPNTATARVSVIDGRLIYAANPGGMNKVTVEGSGTTYTVHDAGATVSPTSSGTACTNVDSRTLSCTGVTKVTLSTGDLNDQITALVDLPITVNTGSGASIVATGAGDDTINGGSGGDTVTAGIGNDTIFGNGGADVVDGELGDDVVRGGDGDDELVGAEGVDELYGEAGADLLGGAGAAQGADLYDGGEGNDTLLAQAHDEIFRGGAGQDLVSFEGLASSVRAEIGTAGNGSRGENDVIESSVEDLKGSGRSDVLIGNDGPNWLNGGPGEDEVSGLGGDDVLDEAQDNASDDDLSGGSGTDRVTYRTRDKSVTATLDGVANDGTATAGENDFIRSDVEGIDGGDRDDVLIGNAGSNALTGGPGSDKLQGLGGVDAYNGGSGTGSGWYAPCLRCADGAADAVSYAEKATKVTASLDGVANDGVTGEIENIPASIEKLIGGTSGDDLGAGTYPALLEGGPGVNVLRGGSAADTILARNGQADTITCGGAADVVRADTADATPADCETKDVSPALEITGGPAEGGYATDSTPEFSFEAPHTSGVAYQCKVEAGTTAGSGTFTSCSSPWSPSATTPDGAAVFSVRTVIGGVFGTPVTRAFKIDTTIGDTTWTATPPAMSFTTSATFAIESNGQDWIECSLDGAPWKRCSASAQLYDLTPGSHTFKARKADVAGNVDTTPASHTWTVIDVAASAPTPSAVSFTPTPALLDWAHWGNSAGMATDRRNVTPALITTPFAVNGGTLAAVNSSPVYSWTDAAGTASGSSSWGIGTGAANDRQLVFTAKAVTDAVRTLKVYVGVRGAATTGRLEVTLGAGTRVPVTETVASTSDTTVVNRVYTVRYKATIANQSLAVGLRQLTGGTNPASAVILYGATVS